MIRRPRRTSAWVLLAVLVLGIAGMAGSAIGSTTTCCPGTADSERAPEPQPCQWVTPAACCDAALAVQAAGWVAPLAPTTCIGTPCPSSASGTSRSTLIPVFATPWLIAVSTVVLQL